MLAQLFLCGRVFPTDRVHIAAAEACSRPPFSAEAYAVKARPASLASGLSSRAMDQSPARRSSFGGMLLRRTKSGDMKKQQQQAKAQEVQRHRDAALPQSPPRLPVLYNGAPAPQLGLGTEVRPDSLAIISGTTGSTGAEHSSNYSISSTARPSMEAPRSAYNVPPPPPIPNGFDPYANATSMAHRGRYSYASSAVSTINSPRRVRRRKDPTAFK